MSWETIENAKPPSKSAGAPPARGVRVSTRGGARASRYIVIGIGAELAKAAGIAGEARPVRLMFGTGSDAGKIAVSVDMGGGFLAKREKRGSYRLTINRAAAAGRIALDFPAFSIERLEAIRPQALGQRPMFVFTAPRAMLAVDDD